MSATAAVMTSPAEDLVAEVAGTLLSARFLPVLQGSLHTDMVAGSCRFCYISMMMVRSDRAVGAVSEEREWRTDLRYVVP